MLHTFERDTYSVVLSQNDRVIFLKMTDNINFVSYEGNLEQKELQVQLDLADIYQLIHKCLLGEPEYSVDIIVQSNQTMQLRFSAVVGGFLKIKFTAVLREKLMSNDGQLTTQFHRMEQKYGALLKRLEGLEEQCTRQQAQNMQLMDRVANAEIYLGEGYGAENYRWVLDIRMFCNINETNVELIEPATGLSLPNIDGNACVPINPLKIKSLYRLENLKISGQRKYAKSKIEFESETLKSLVLENITGLCSLEGINKLPSLTTLEITRSAELTNVPAVLSSYKHRIQELTFKGCTKINVVELQTYCQTNGIKLNIS